MTTPFNLTHQIKRVLNRHSEDPYFGNLVSALQNVSSNSDIDDVIYETAGSLCPIYYAELKVWIPEHIDEINDCVKEYEILPEDFDLFKVAQMAWVKDAQIQYEFLKKHSGYSNRGSQVQLRVYDVNSQKWKWLGDWNDL